jgi:hypothetical protein
MDKVQNSSNSEYYTPPPCEGELEYLHVDLRVESEAMKREPDAWGYYWATLPLGHINTVTWSHRFGVGHKADDLSP